MKQLLCCVALCCVVMFCTYAVLCVFLPLRSAMRERVRVRACVRVFVRACGCLCDESHLMFH